MIPFVSFPCCSFYWCFLRAVQPCMFLLHQTIVYTNLYLLVWLFFCYCLQFLGFNFCNICIAALCAPKLRTTLPLCPLWPLGHPLQLPAVFFPLTASQNTPCLPIPGSLWLVFSTPLVSLRPITTIFVHNCRFIPILDYLSEPPQNIMSGEISPAIAPKSCPYRPINVPLSLVFVFPGHHMT